MIFPVSGGPRAGFPGRRANVCTPSGGDPPDGAAGGWPNGFPLAGCKGFPYKNFPGRARATGEMGLTGGCGYGCILGIQD